MSEARSRKSRFSANPAAVTLAHGPDRVDYATRQRRAEALIALQARQMRVDPDGAADFVRERLIGGYENLTDARRLVVQQGEGWVARWVLAEVNGVLVARSLHLEPEARTTPPGGISTNLLRELSPSSASAAGAAHDLDTVEHMIDRFEEDHRPKTSDTETPSRRSPGRPTVPPAELAAVAEAYLEELQRDRGVTRRVANRLGLPEDTARDRIRMARSRGFLTPTQRGRSGGAAGPALLAYRENEN